MSTKHLLKAAALAAAVATVAVGAHVLQKPPASPTSISSFNGQPLADEHGRPLGFR